MRAITRRASFIGMIDRPNPLIRIYIFIVSLMAYLDKAYKKPCFIQ